MENKPKSLVKFSYLAPMSKIKFLVFTLLVISIFSSCDKVPADEQNILLQEWVGPFGGVPAFDKMKLEDVKPAILEGIQLQLEDIDAITNNEETPTFENTIVELELAGAELNRAFSYYGILSGNMSSPEFREIQGELSPILAEFQSKVIQNEKLFARIKTVYDAAKKNPLDSEEQRVVELTYKKFEMNGALLNAEQKEEYAAISTKLSTLYNTFSDNVLHDEENYVTFLTEDQLGGLSDGFIKSAASISRDKGQEGKYAITNTRSSIDPFLTYSIERELRKKVWTNFYSRGDNGDEYDNNELIAEILKLRRKKVEILGYSNYAEWRLQDRMAKNPTNALNLMESVWSASIGRVAEEVSDMQDIADAEGSEIIIEPWDYRFYAEKVRKLKYDLNSEEVKQYLQLDKLTDAMHYVAGRLFDYKFTLIAEGTIPVYHPDVRVWEVTNQTTGENIGLWYLDPYTREGKRSGAWANTFRSHTTLDGQTNVLATNNSNFVKPAEGEALLVSWDDANTFFHEFGHALHFFSSNVKYPTLNGGVRDYTEFQSQLLERWLSTDEVISNYLVHNKTGEPIPESLVQKIKNTTTFNQGFSTTEYLGSALMDMKLHLADPADIDIDKFERETLIDLKMPKELPMRHRTPHFGHIFSGEGYATAYYGYMWADVLTADAAEAFADAPGGFYDKDLADKLVKYLFAPRNAIDPAKAYRLFRGRDAKIEALMRDRGFSVVGE